MSKEFYDEQTLTQYLLGSLPAAETERLDELCLTDDEAAEALQAVEHDLVDAYAQDELTAATRAQFNSHYLTSQLRREKVAFAQTFQAQPVKNLVAQQVAKGQTEAAATFTPKGKSAGWLSALFGPNATRPAWQWGAIVAGLALLVAGSWLIFERLRAPQQTAHTQTPSAAPARRETGAQSAPEEQPTDPAQSAEEVARAERERLAQEQTEREQQRIAEEKRRADEQRAIERQQAATQQRSTTVAGRGASLVLMPQMRGASPVQTLSIPAQAAYVAVRLQLEPNEFSTFGVALLDETTGRIVWRSHPLKTRAVGGNQVLTLNFPARLLKPQTNYVLRVTGSAAEIVDTYSFRVVK